MDRGEPLSVLMSWNLIAMGLFPSIDAIIYPDLTDPTTQRIYPADTAFPFTVTIPEGAQGSPLVIGGVVQNGYNRFSGPNDEHPGHFQFSSDDVVTG